VNNKPSSNHPPRRRRSAAAYERKSDKIYLDGIVVESLPGVKFRVKIERSKGLEPLILECQTRAILKVKKIKILKGDTVTVELDPQDLSKGQIVSRQF
jgi:translation initiation factor IF-1